MGAPHDDGPQGPSQLCVGIALTTDPHTTRELLEQLCLELAEATGVPVKARGVWHYHHLIEGLGDGEIDIVWLPPILALRATAEGRAVPIAMPVRNGVSSYRTALFSRQGSAVRSLADLKGVSAAWVDRQSAAGYLIIRAHLEAQGVDLEQAFAAEQFVGTHDGVAGAVLDGEVDVGATYVYYADPPETGGELLRAGWGAGEVQVIAHSAPIPSDILAVDRRVPAELRELVQSAFVDEHNERLQVAARNLLSAEGFVVPTAEHLAPLTALLAGIRDAGGEPTSLFPPPGPKAPKGTAGKRRS